MTNSLEKGVYGDMSPEEIKQKSLQNTRKLMKGALGGFSEQEIEAKKLETMELLHGKEGNVSAEETSGENQEKSFKDAMIGFQSDLTHIRKMVAEYHNLSDERLKELKSADIYRQAEMIYDQVEKQIAIMSDPYSKGDLANLQTDLENALKPMPESLKKAANE